MEETEIWKDVVGWEEKYQVSNLGRVWNKWADVEVAQVLTGDPLYYYVNLNLNKQYKLRRVNILVATAFIKNPNNLPVVDHKDRDKLNNEVSNLRWTDNSGNQRNTENSRFIGDVHLVDYVQRYENPSAAYSHFSASFLSGCSEQECVDRYEEYLGYGLKRLKVEYNGKEEYLSDLCDQYGKDWESVRSRLSQGWDVWNALFNVPPSQYQSVEIKSNLVTGVWCRGLSCVSDKHSASVVSRLVYEGYYYEDILTHDSLDHVRTTVLGITGTKKELCDHFKVSLSAVETRVKRQGMSFEEALVAQPKRIKRVRVNGVVMTPKSMYESFGINARAANSYKSNRDGRTFEDTLTYYGVDLTGVVIETEFS